MLSFDQQTRDARKELGDLGERAIPTVERLRSLKRQKKKGAGGKNQLSSTGAAVSTHVKTVPEK